MVLHLTVTLIKASRSSHQAETRCPAILILLKSAILLLITKSAIIARSAIVTLFRRLSSLSDFRVQDMAAAAVVHTVVVAADFIQHLLHTAVVMIITVAATITTAAMIIMAVVMMGTTAVAVTIPHLAITIRELVVGRKPTTAAKFRFKIATKPRFLLM